jgi:hypothetical protein
MLEALLLSVIAAFLWIGWYVMPLLTPRLEGDSEKMPFPFRSLVALVMFVTVIGGLALMLLDFYRDVRAGKLRGSHALIGWIGSTAYHAALAGIEYCSGGAKLPAGLLAGPPPAFPWWMWGSAGAAALASMLLLLWTYLQLAYPGEAKMQPDHI